MAGGDGHSHVEYFSNETKQWIKSTKYPYMNKIHDFEIVTHEDSFIIFGGRGPTRGTAVIAKFDTLSNEWTQVGFLRQRRHAFSVIQTESEYLVVGGTGTKMTETCKMSNDRITCFTRTPSLTHFR